MEWRGSQKTNSIASASPAHPSFQRVMLLRRAALTIAVLLTALWLCSLFVSFEACRNHNRNWSVTILDGCIHYALYVQGTGVQRYPKLKIPSYVIHRNARGAPWNSREKYGFVLPGSTSGTISRRIQIPIWLSILPWIVLQLCWKRKTNRQDNACSCCGYPIATSSMHCPECGTMIPEEQLVRLGLLPEPREA